MTWKDWPAWIKGAIIGAIILIVIMLLGMRLFPNVFAVPLALVAFFLEPGLFLGGDVGTFRIVLFTIIGYLFFPLIGGIIGYIIGKESWPRWFKWIIFSIALILIIILLRAHILRIF